MKTTTLKIKQDKIPYFCYGGEKSDNIFTQKSVEYRKNYVREEVEGDFLECSFYNCTIIGGEFQGCKFHDCVFLAKWVEVPVDGMITNSHFTLYDCWHAGSKYKNIPTDESMNRIIEEKREFFSGDKFSYIEIKGLYRTPERIIFEAV